MEEVSLLNIKDFKAIQQQVINLIKKASVFIKVNQIKK